MQVEKNGGNKNTPPSLLCFSSVSKAPPPAEEAVMYTQSERLWLTSETDKAITGFSSRHYGFLQITGDIIFHRLPHELMSCTSCFIKI